MGLLLKCEHVGFGYENQDAVLDVNLEVNEGDYICIVGENGSGKSTLMKGILGLLKPTSGRIEYSEELKKAGIGYLPQQTDAQKDFPATVFEVVISGCLGKRGSRPFYSMKEKKEARANLDRLGIRDLEKSCFRELSGGQKQRVLIARALCATDKLLILDEPITGLDPSAILDFYQLIRKLNQEEKVAILMVSHDMANIVHQGGKILQMRQKPLFWGTMKEYVKSEIAHSFLGREELATLGHRCGVPMQKDGIRKMQKPEMGSETDSETKQHLKDRNAEKFPFSIRSFVLDVPVSFVLP